MTADCCERSICGYATGVFSSRERERAYDSVAFRTSLPSTAPTSTDRRCSGGGFARRSYRAVRAGSAAGREIQGVLRWNVTALTVSHDPRRGGGHSAFWDRAGKA